MKKQILPATTLDEERFIVLPKIPFMNDVQKKEDGAFTDIIS